MNNIVAGETAILAPAIKRRTRYDQDVIKRGPRSVFGDPLTEAPRRLVRSRLMNIQPPTPTSVYLYYDLDNILLYVGITSRGVRRQGEHNDSKRWWPLVARQEVEHFASRPLAAARERDLIGSHRPPYNVQHNPEHAEVRMAYEAYQRARADMDVWRDAIRASQMQVRLDVHEFHDSPNVILRTKLIDSLIAPVVTIDDIKKPSVQGIGKGGRVQVVEIFKRGPFALLRLSTTSKHPIKSAHASLKFGPAQADLYVRNVQVQLDHSDPELCTSRCPRPAEKAA